MDLESCIFQRRVPDVLDKRGHTAHHSPTCILFKIFFCKAALNRSLDRKKALTLIARKCPLFLRYTSLNQLFCLDMRDDSKTASAFFSSLKMDRLEQRRLEHFAKAILSERCVPYAMLNARSAVECTTPYNRAITEEKHVPHLNKFVKQNQLP